MGLKPRRPPPLTTTREMTSVLARRPDAKMASSCVPPGRTATSTSALSRPAGQDSQAESQRWRGPCSSSRGACPLCLRRRIKNELNFPQNFERLVLGCIDADFCKRNLVGKEIGKLLTISTRCT